MTEAMAQATETLQKYWGYSTFRPLQKVSIDSILAGRDTLVVLPTGGGKSICFQVPALLLDGMAIVVSPLISLMKDQVDALTTNGIDAVALYSGLDESEYHDAMERIRSGSTRLLYVAPERLAMEGFQDFLSQRRISFIAVDEAHCISMWGHDFRPEYRQLSILRARFPDVPLHGFTATATQDVRDDIAVQLEMRKPHIVVGSFDRPNLTYAAKERGNVVGQVIDMCRRHDGESGIVYCISRKKTEALATDLRNNGITALPYHAGLDPTTRHRNQDDFIKDKVRVVVATVAFGMGIDKPDVRFVVHSSLPKSLEHYQQESGRAGRDGLGSDCLLLYKYGDLVSWKRLMDDMPAPALKAASAKLESTLAYAQSFVCRRKTIMGYFGEKYPKENCGNCDICLGNFEIRTDALVISQKILSCVKRLDESHNAAYTKRVLVGSKDKRILEAGHDSLSTYGILAEHDRTLVGYFIDQLIAQSFLSVGDDGALKITAAGWDAIRAKQTPRLVVRKTEAPGDVGPVRKADDLVGVDLELFEELRHLRRMLADKKNLPPYVIFGDKSLRDIARVRPTTLEKLRGCHGVGDAKLRDYGNDFLQTLHRYYQANPTLSTNNASAAAPSPPRAPASATTNGRTAVIEFRKGATLEAVMKQLGCARSTAFKYLTEYINNERITDTTPWVDKATAARISIAAEKHGTDRLKPIFDELSGEIDYDRIRIVVAGLRNHD